MLCGMCRVKGVACEFRVVDVSMRVSCDGCWVVGVV